MNKPSKNMKSILCALVICIVLLSSTGLVAFAASPVIDIGATGSLLLDPQYGGKTVPGCVFKVYLVATLEDPATLRFALKAPFDALAGRLDVNALRRANAEQLQAAVALLLEYIEFVPDDDMWTTADDRISGLPPGLYLVVQSVAPANYQLSSPFLVSMPVTGLDGRGWEYDIIAYPKMGYTPPEPPTPPTPPEPPPEPPPYIPPPPLTNLIEEPPVPGGPGEPEVPIEPEEVPKGPMPQTGLLQWPIPVLALSGVTFITAGLSVNTKKKKHGKHR